MKSTVYEAQRRYTERNLRSGQARVNLWIPEKHAAEIKEIASRMRSGQWKTKQAV